MDTFQKVSDSEIERISTIPAVETRHVYKIDFLLAQKTRILLQKAQQMAERDAELAEVQALLDAAANLGMIEGKE